MKVKEPTRTGSAAQPLAHAGDCDPLQVLKGSNFKWPFGGGDSSVVRAPDS